MAGGPEGRSYICEVNVAAPRGPGWWRPLTRADRWALALLVAVPALIFIVPALAGHPAIAQDNFIQNYPLRVLSGRQIASGHLPLLNPLADAGTPLLGGMNAGSFYPASLLFVVLPPLVAWVINLVAVYVTAAVGLFALARWLGFGPAAALAGAAVFTYAGSMMGQMVHLGVVEGYSLLPWLVLCLLVAARTLLDLGGRGSWRSHLRAALPALLGVTAVVALSGLSGEPRAIAETELVGAVVVIVELVVHAGVSRASARGRVAFVLGALAAALWGVGIAAAQLLPGWSFITQSERATVGYPFFGDGSLPVRWSALFLDQDLFGGTGALGTAHYFATANLANNLAEVSGYVGVLALVAVVAFTLRCLSRRDRGGTRPLVVFLVLLVVGLVAAYGSYTPIGHLFHGLPLFGETRLQSRNVVLCDLGAAVLLAWFVDHVLDGRWASVSLVGARRWAILAPAGAVVVLSVVALGAPTALESAFGVAVTAGEASHQELSLALHVVIGLSVIALLTVGRRRRYVGRWVFVVLLLDLGVFNLFSDAGFATGSTSVLPTRGAAVAVLGTQGRYAIVDQGQANYGTFEALGVPNLNAFTGLASVEGYGALVDARYDNVTGTHELVTLNPCNLMDGALAPLRLDTLVISEQSLLTPAGTPDALPACRAPITEDRVTRYFGALLHVNDVTFHMADVTHGTVAVQLFGATGSALGRPISVRDAATVRVPVSPGVASAGVSISARTGVDVLSTSVRVASGDPRTYGADGAYQGAMDSPHWHLVATTSEYAVFRATSLDPPDWLEGSTVGSAVLSSRDSSWGDQWVSVRAAHALTLVWSEAYLSGWRATFTNERTGAQHTVEVGRDNLVQDVSVPIGTWSIHFTYHAPYLDLGLIISGGTFSVFALSVIVVAFRRRRVRG